MIFLSLQGTGGFYGFLLDLFSLISFKPCDSQQGKWPRLRLLSCPSTWAPVLPSLNTHVSSSVEMPFGVSCCLFFQFYGKENI